MLKRLSILSAALAATLSLSAQQLPEWQDHRTVSVGKYPARTTFMSYERRDDAVADDFAASEHYTSLNGVWMQLDCRTDTASGKGRSNKASGLSGLVTCPDIAVHCPFCRV